MNRKIAAFLTIASFILFDFACTQHTTRMEMPEKAWGGNPEILAVLKKSGEFIEFSKEYPARIIGDKVVSGGSFANFQVARSDIKEIVNERRRTVGIVKNDGRRFDVVRVIRQDRDVIAFQAKLSGTAIPLSEIDTLTVRRVNAGMTFLATIGVVGAVLAGTIVLIALTKKSCPFIYSWNGSRFVFDAEPYGGAICEGLKRSELCALENIKETHGVYRLMVTNEVNETQYTDELKLVVVDHPRGTAVVPDFSGGIHTVSAPISLLRAFDKSGRDLMSYIGARDWIFWQTRESDLEAAAGEGWRDELVFEFPKPAGARKARLVFNGCNTLWGSEMIQKVLELRGRTVGEWYRDVNRLGPSLFRTIAWDTREELYRLHLRVETEHGWTARGMIMGGGPLVSEDRIYDLDIGDVKGDVLRLKLTPAGGYWMINWLAVDYGEDLPCQVTELAPVQAVDGRGRDVRSLLTLDDRSYLVMPNIGDRAEVTFLAPPPPSEGSLRSVYVRASGYYDIHLAGTGEPQTEMMRRVAEEPGFILKFSADQYKEAARANRERDRTH
jgi:hypothetical protein